jgi:hypothetical protein
MSTSPVTTITDELLAEIEAAALKSVEHCQTWLEVGGFSLSRCDSADAQYIEVSSPTNIRAIITELRAMRAENEARQASMVFVRDAADILRTLIENIDSKGNYSPEATALFLNQVLGCIHAAMQEQPQ